MLRSGPKVSMAKQISGFQYSARNADDRGPSRTDCSNPSIPARVKSSKNRQRRRALLGGTRYRSPAEFVVGLELGGVIQLLKRAVARVGRVTLGVSQDIPGRSGPPAELAHPDVALLGQPVRAGRPGERAVCPWADHLARLQPVAALNHRGWIEDDLHSSVAPGQGDGSAEREPRVGSVTRSVKHHDVPCAPAQCLDQAEVVVVTAVGYVHPRVAVAQM